MPYQSPDAPTRPYGITPRPTSITPRPTAITPRPTAITPRPVAPTPRPTKSNPSDVANKRIENDRNRHEAERNRVEAERKRQLARAEALHRKSAAQAARSTAAGMREETKVKRFKSFPGGKPMGFNAFMAKKRSEDSSKDAQLAANAYEEIGLDASLLPSDRQKQLKRRKAMKIKIYVKESGFTDPVNHGNLDDVASLSNPAGPVASRRKRRRVVEGGVWGSVGGGAGANLVDGGRQDGSVNNALGKPVSDGGNYKRKKFLSTFRKK